MSRPMKGTLPLLQPRWVLLEYRDGRLYFEMTFAQKPTRRNYHRPMGQWVAFHSTFGTVATYETDYSGEIMPCKIEARVLLYNRGGIAARSHWQIVDKVGPFRGYYVLLDAGENRVLSTVSVANDRL